MACGVGKFPERNGYEFNLGCWSRVEDNEQAAECAANSCTQMCDTTNCSPGELPLTNGKFGQTCVWKVRVVTGEKN